jgi:hypothetical protein
MTLVAKPVIDKQFWILRDNDRKVGNVEACAGGYQVRINNQVTQFKTIRMVERHVNVQFESTTKPKKTHNEPSLVHGYPAISRVYNPMWDLKLRVPIYTRTNKSKSWYAAGWYNVKRGRHWEAMQDPKLIVLQRYPYQGPFHSEEDIANDHASTTIC